MLRLYISSLPARTRYSVEYKRSHYSVYILIRHHPSYETHDSGHHPTHKFSQLESAVYFIHLFHEFHAVCLSISAMDYQRFLYLQGHPDLCTEHLLLYRTVLAKTVRE